LVWVAGDVIQIIDYSLIETARPKVVQDSYVASGASTLPWPLSKHNVYDGRPLAEAMDIWPYVPPFGALSGHPDQIAAITAQTGQNPEAVREFVYKAFARLAGVVEACAHARGYVTRWGGDWDGDGNLLDQSFHDLPHHEIVR
jgi:hypothetical protein